MKFSPLAIVLLAGAMQSASASHVRRGASSSIPSTIAGMGTQVSSKASSVIDREAVLHQLHQSYSGKRDLQDSSPCLETDAFNVEFTGDCHYDTIALEIGQLIDPVNEFIANHEQSGSTTRPDQVGAYGWFISQGWKEKYPLHYASMKCNDEGIAKIKSLVLLKDYDPNQKMTDWYDSEPLGWAASFGCIDTVKVLLQLGADPTNVNKGGNDAWGDAAREGHSGVLELLNDYSTFASREAVIPWIDSYSEGGVETRDDQLGVGGWFRATFDTTKYAIILAALTCDTRAVEELVSSGTDPNLKMTTWYDSTPIQWASSLGCVDTVKTLTKLGADPFEKNAAGNNAFDDAIREGHQKTLNYLIAYDEVRKLFSSSDARATSAYCGHSAEVELSLLAGTPGEEITRLRIEGLCAAADEKFDFGDISEEGYQFDKRFYDGDTHWNTEVETLLESEDGSATNVLSEDAANVKVVYDEQAQSNTITWPGEMTNFDLDTCDLSSAMCCWTADRQANDNNGNCATPYDENCRNADPADNTDLCLVDMSRSPDSNYLKDGFAIFQGDDNNGEGAIHCHGFAWSAENDRFYGSRLKGNNLFYVSMYDHLYTRGYVRNVAGAPMCACLEQMPVVSRSDCTEMDVEERWLLSRNSSGLAVSRRVLDISFNSCQGLNGINNDLEDYYRRLEREDVVTHGQLNDFSKIVVGNGQCPAAQSSFLRSKGL